MDSGGVPHTSKRAGSRTSGGGVAKPPTPKGGTAKSTTIGSPRPGPVDPRTEDPSSPRGISRAAKTVWRRPGALTPRTAKHRETGSIDAPIEFSVALPLAPVDEPVAKTGDGGPDTVRDIAVSLARTVEVLAPAPQHPTELVPTIFVPTAPNDLVPTELVPTELVRPPSPILYDEAATIDDVTMIGPILDTRPLRRPVHFRRVPKPRVRRVTRVVRHVDTWSVFKVALVFNVFFYAVALVAGVLLWQVAYATGTIDNVEKFFEGFGWATFDFNGGQIYHNAWIAGLFVAVGLTGLSVLLATLFNLITDLVGGIRLSVLEEEVQTRAERGTETFVYQPTSTTPTDADAMGDGDMDAQVDDPPPPEPTEEAIAG